MFPCALGPAVVYRIQGYPEHEEDGGGDIYAYHELARDGTAAKGVGGNDADGDDRYNDGDHGDDPPD